MKGTILPGHVGVNRYELLVLGVVPLVFHEVSGMESETPFVWKNIHGEPAATWALSGLAVSKRATPDAEMANDGDMAAIEWTFKYDSMIPLP